MIEDQEKNQTIKNILSALAVVVFGFILLNVAFIFDFLFQSLIDTIVGFFTTADVNMEWSWYPPVKHAMFVVLIGLISWYVLRSKLGVLYKAIYMAVPLAVVFMTIGIFTYEWPIAAYSLGILFSIGVLYYFYRTKQPWLFYFTLILMILTMLMVGLLGVEI
jgi:hypothetical protein